MNQEVNYEPYKNYGKREMLYNIQRQINIMNNDDTIRAIKKMIIKLEKILQIEEETQGIKTELGIEEDIVNGSKIIINEWSKEI